MLDLIPSLTVGLLEASTGRATAEFLRLSAARVRHDQAAVVRSQDVLDLLLVGLIHVLPEVRDNRLRDGLTNRIDLRDETTATNAHTDVHLREALLAEEEDRLVHLHLQHLRLDELKRAAVDAHEAVAGLAQRDCHRRLLPAVGLHTLGLRKRFLHTVYQQSP